MLRSALSMLVLMTLITGVLYPLLITAVAQGIFPQQANGSLVMEGGRVKGSRLIGQQFTEASYFWPRLSATSPAPYNSAASSGSNFGPKNPAREKVMELTRKALQAADPTNTGDVPIDLLTASGSGLDPHISPEAAEYQAGRVARARGMSAEAVRSLIARQTEGRQLGFLGQPVVNVAALNRALDGK